MTPLRKRFYEDMQLHGLAARTQESYVQAVQGLAKHYKRSPDLLSDEEIRAFFLHLINERKSSASTLTIYFSGIKLFYEKTLKRTWRVLGIERPPRSPPVAACGPVDFEYVPCEECALLAGERRGTSVCTGLFFSGRGSSSDQRHGSRELELDNHGFRHNNPTHRD